MKKTVSLLLVLLFLAAGPGMALAGATINTDSEFPIVMEPTTFRLMVSPAQYMEDFPTNKFTVLYQEMTNVYFDIEIVPNASRSDMLNVTLASGDYPDAFLNFNIDHSTILSYAEMGVFVPMTPYLDEYAPNLTAILSENQRLKSALTYPDGNIYAIGQCEESTLQGYPNLFWIYEPWLAALGLDYPRTTEEFHQVLKAFKEQDPNGNGVADEIPYSGSAGGLIDFVMSAFIYAGDPDQFIVKDGKLDVAYRQPEWKEGLEYIRTLYSDGLIDPESFTQTSALRRQKMANDPVILGSTMAGVVSSFLDYNMADGRDSEYFTVKPLIGPYGQSYATYNPEAGVANTMGQMVITSACEQPEVLVRWIDGLMSEEMTMRSVYGEEGVDWRWAEASEVGALGEDGIFVLISSWTDVANEYWKRQGPDYRGKALVEGEVYTSGNWSNNGWLQRELNYVEFTPPQEALVGRLILNSDQTSQIAEIKTSLTGYVDEMFVQFVTGNIDLEQGWDGYLAELTNIGIDRYVEVYDSVYQAKSALDD